MLASDIRAVFINFFEERKHQSVRSSSVIPYNDNTLLFTNAGMNQFKDYFLGLRTPSYKRAVTSQKVIRAGGKHNDLDNVGKTPRHHTFFEMLGNFSFGDYFKKDAIEYAWVFLIDVLKLPSDKLAISIFEEDDEAFNIWHRHIGIDKEKIALLDEKSNFWSMGDVGPCGPCSEIHYDLNGIQKNRSIIESLTVEDDRFLEIWNLVFMQFNRDKNGVLEKLPRPSIDTGMGLERIASILQNKKSNYDTDLFLPIIDSIAKKAGYFYRSDSKKDVACRVIADHLRSISFIIADGVVPSNEGRGYVLRRIIRRAIRFAFDLGLPSGNLSTLIHSVISTFGTNFLELEHNQKIIEKTLLLEEEKFLQTFQVGMDLLTEMIEDTKAKQQTVFEGEKVFFLYDTYGFPADITADILEENNLSYNKVDFERASLSQRKKARAEYEKTKNFYQHSVSQQINFETYFPLNKFCGYQEKEVLTAVLAIVSEGKIVSYLDESINHKKVEIILEKTPFYAEGGGQIGDRGIIYNDEFRVEVENTFKSPSGYNISSGTIKIVSDKKITLQMRQEVVAKIDFAVRASIEKHHTATHLLHSALKVILGENARQSGSLVEEKRLRFDFTHNESLSFETKRKVEELVNSYILKNEEISYETLSYNEAVKKGATAIFNEKYGDFVRVVSAGSHSKELCGGCHAKTTGELALFTITQEKAVASGIRRIEACTSTTAFQWMRSKINILENIVVQTKVAEDKLSEYLYKIEEEKNTIIKENKRLQYQAQHTKLTELLEKYIEVASYKVIFEKISSGDLLQTFDYLRGKMERTIVVIYTIKHKKIHLLLGITKDILHNLNAGKIMKQLTPYINGRGGGNDYLAQCGGNNVDGLEKFSVELHKIIRNVSI